MLGAHCSKGYSVTQKMVTLSSGEAELMAAVKASSEAIGLCQLAAAWGLGLEAQVLVDSSAALAVTNRKGNGRLRHVKVGHLWIQECAEREEVVYSKVCGEVNPADLYTKHLHGTRILDLLGRTSQNPQLGEASSRLRLQALRSLAADLEYIPFRPVGHVGPPGGGGVNAHTPCPASSCVRVSTFACA